MMNYLLGDAILAAFYIVLILTILAIVRRYFNISRKTRQSPQIPESREHVAKRSDPQPRSMSIKSSA